jgi:hypothetical protein
MALDLHVMPLWKFWAGEYTTATERFAASTGVPMSRVGRPKALYDPHEAQHLAKGVRLWIERQTGVSQAWEDDGDIAFSEQFQLDAIHAVRAYAAHTDMSPDGPFEIITDFHRSPAVRRILAGVPTEFPHLVFHEDNQGFYVPVDFEYPMKLMGKAPTVGSSVQLMIELATLRRGLGDFPDFAARQQGEQGQEPHPGVALVKHGLAFLYHVCWTSVQTRLPIIFDG